MKESKSIRKIPLWFLISMFVILILSFSLFVFMVNGKDSNKSSQWEKFSTLFKTTKQNTSSYNVEAAGWNVRVIEWIPEDNKKYRCMFVAGTEKAGVGCYLANKDIKNKP